MSDVVTGPTHERAIIARFTPQHTTPQVSCFSCGRTMEANPLGKCAECISSTVDITENAQREGSLVFCGDCGRVHAPPRQWVFAERESGELLSLLLNRIDLGSPDVQLVDAEFLWTEPHSRRTQIRVTVQKEESGVLLEQYFDVEFVESTQQCPQCAKSYTHNKWVANIQIRQHVPHKKTILWLEQVILKSGIHKSISSIEESREGLDLHYAYQKDAEKMAQFLQSHAPVKITKSSELISSSVHTGKASMKFTYSVELPPICREDLVVLPKKVSRSKGGMPRLVLCYKINNSLHFVDPNSARTVQINSGEYQKTPFSTLAAARGNELSEYLVTDVEPTGVINGKFVMADVTVLKMSEMEREFTVRSHLGGILHEGDTALGFDLSTAQYNSDDWDELNSDNIPEVVLVRKVYPDKEKKKKPRKINRIVAEYNDGSVKPDMGSDYEEFIQEMEDMSDLEIDDEEKISAADIGEVL